MSPAIRIAYRHRAGCSRGDCPGHVAFIRSVRDIDPVLRRITASGREPSVEIERVSEVSL